MLHGHKAFLFLLLKKFVFGFVILFLIANILFLLCYVLPDNPIYLLFPGYIPPDLIEEWETLLGLKRPMIEIYFDFIAGLFTCDFGVSFKFYPRGAILSLIGPYIGRTLFIFGYSVALSLILGGIVGKLISGRRNSISERILSGFAAFGFAFSSFLVATILIIITLSLTWDWPLAGFSSPSFLYPHNMDFNSKFIDILKHALLPLASVILPSSCGIYMLIRRGSFDWNRSRNIAPEDENHSFFSEVGSFFGAFIPVRPLLRLYMAFIMLSTIVIDIIFNYQGLGYLSLSSYMNDFPLTIASIWIQALILFFAIFVLELVLDIAIYVMPAREKSNYIVTIDEDIARERFIARSDTQPRECTQSAGQTGNDISYKEILSTIVSAFLHRPTGVIALTIFLAILVIGIIGPFVASENPLAPTYHLPQPPSDRHPFGTDYGDTDVLSQFLYGARTDVAATLFIMVVAIFGGLLLGIVGSIFGRIVHTVLGLVLGALLLLCFAIPFIIGALGRNALLAYALCAALAMIPIALTVRNEMAVLRAERGEFIGWLSRPRFKIIESVKKIAPKYIFATKISVVVAIFTYYILFFFNFVNVYSISWGWMVGKAFHTTALLNLWWWLFVPPIIGILLLVLSIYFVLDSLEIVLENIAGGKNGEPNAVMKSGSKERKATEKAPQ